MTEIQLRQSWTLREQIGQGGFGRVFRAVNDSGDEVAIKLIPKAPGADRELLVEDLSGVPNIIQLLDFGDAGNDWALAMPLADRSLLDFANGRCLTADEGIPILDGIAAALESLAAAGIVHRDLKPENVLLYRGRWCLSDFGIARYAEATTAVDTQKFAMSPPYAGPERWREDRATPATDVYSFGVMAYELLAGQRPFLGPSTSDFRRQHLHEWPPTTPGVSTALGSLIAQCLLKAPGARPTPAQIRSQLAAIAAPSRPTAGVLQQANASAVETLGAQQAEAEANRSTTERWKSLADAAGATLAVLLDSLRSAVTTSAPVAGNNFPFVLNGATLDVEPLLLTKPGPFEGRRYRSCFDVIAYTAVVLQIPQASMYSGRSHSLWYCDAQQDGVFRWYELAFMMPSLSPQRFKLDPTALAPQEDALLAIAPIMAPVQLAWPFTAIDQGDDEDFIERWLTWFGQAATGRLEHPRSMPERSPDGSYRKPRPRS